jgi:hypothetical protein
MPIAKKVLSYNSGTWITCCWFECEKPGYELHKTIFHEHARDIPCDRGEHVNFIFCSERHKMLFVNSHSNHGQLPAGYRSTIL